MLSIWLSYWDSDVCVSDLNRDRRLSDRDPGGILLVHSAGLLLNQSDRHWRIQFNYNRRATAFRVPTLVGCARIPSPAEIGRASGRNRETNSESQSMIR